jgi:hypothetical protein
MNTERIIFKGKAYPLYVVFVDGIEHHLSVVALADALMNVSGAFVSDEAYRIDMGITYYLSEDEVNLSFIQIQNIIRNL